MVKIIKNIVSGVIMMYKHMFAQRKKALGTSAPVKKKAK